MASPAVTVTVTQSAVDLETFTLSLPKIEVSLSPVIVSQSLAPKHCYDANLLC
jgi:hypothetical protein